MGIIDSVYPTGVAVQKSNVIADDKSGKRRNMAATDDVRNTDLSGQTAGIYVRQLQQFYDLDTGDTTSPDDGDECIIDLEGNRFKKIDLGTGSSGIQSVVAGTNITVDGTDPLNPVISATGGGGGGIDSVVAGSNLKIDDTDPDNPIVSSPWLGFNVLDFGAVGDGSTNDATAIQNAIDAAEAAAALGNLPHGKVFAPSGYLFKINTGLIINEPILVDFQSLILYNATNGVALTINSVKPTTYGQEQGSYKFLGFRQVNGGNSGTPSSVNTGGATGVRINSLAFSRVEIGEIQNFTYRGLWLDGTGGVFTPQVIQHVSFVLGQIVNNGQGIYMNSTDAATSSCQVCRFDIQNIYQNFTNIRMDDDASDSHTFFCNAMDNNHASGYGLQCSGSWNTFFIGYTASAIRFETGAANNFVQVGNTIATGVSFTDVDGYATSKNRYFSAGVDWATQLGSYVNLNQIAVPTADISLNNHKIAFLADPTNSHEATNKSYVDNKVSKKRVINAAARGAGFELWQRSTSIAIAASATAYANDGWYLLTNANQAATVSRQSALATTSLYSAKVQRNSGQTGTGVIRYAMPLDSSEIAMLLGSYVALSFTMKEGANQSFSHSVNFAVYAGTGAPAKRGASSYTSETTVLSGTVTTTTTGQRVTVTSAAVLPTSTTQLEIQFNFTPSGTAGADDSFTVDSLQLEPVDSASASASAYSPLDLSEQYAKAAAFLKSYQPGSNSPFGMGFAFNTTTFISWTPFAVRMRAAPTLTIVGALSDYQYFGAAFGTPTAITIDASGPDAVALNVGASGLTAGQALTLRAVNGTAQLLFTAEL